MVQMILLCGTGEAQPSSAGCTAGAEPLWAELGDGQGCLGLDT